MPLESELRFALAALDMSLATPEQVMEALAASLKGGEGLESRIRRAAELDDDCASSVLEAVEGGSPRSVDSALRSAMLSLELPPGARGWLASLPARRSRGPAFQAAPQGERYRLGAPIASGGLGRVFEAEDRDLARTVALKMLKEGATTHDEDRFMREARLAARLEHPVIVPTYDFGAMSDGAGGRKLYLCMKRIRGRDLGQLLRALQGGDAATQEAWTRGRLLGVVQDVCLGIAYAHSKGVIHRDLKPSNVMVGEFGETIVVDWGLAKVMGEAEDARPDAGPEKAGVETTHLTLVGSVIGTPAYMPPEQAEGRLDELDTRSDVYSLGGILYAVLTWQAPVVAATATEAIETVRTGRLDAPSERVRLTVAAGRRTPDPVPPELDAICMKAMAYHRHDRFQDALEMHRELQLFLDGVREKERRTREAAARVAAGRALLAKYAALATAIREQEAAAAKLEAAIARHGEAEEKRPLWAARGRVRELEEERIAAYAGAAAEFGQARAVDAGCEEAADGLCDLYLARLAEAEKRRDRGEELLLRSQVAHLGRAARLDAPGTLSVRAFAYGCKCLAPVRTPGWRADTQHELSLVWRDGAPVPGVEPLPADRMIPAQRFPDGMRRWGHTTECLTTPIPGAEVRIARYETRDVRLVPGPEKIVGKTPIAGLPLPPGSWRCSIHAPGFAPVHFPFVIRRGEPWDQEVALYRPGEIPAGFVQVPGGRFSWGGAFAGGGEDEAELSTRDVFVATFSVTAGEYLEFLNDLCARGEFEEAHARAPREGTERFLAFGSDRFELAPPGEPSAQSSADFPVIGVSWTDAVAYANWRSARDGIAYSLPVEDEWEKAARGVDRRIYPFGDEFDWSFALVAGSLPAGPRLRPVGSFPADESPYGIRDMAGTASNWLLNGVELPYRHYRALRGGAWFIGPNNAKICYRRAFVPETATRYYGLRLCARPVAY